MLSSINYEEHMSTKMNYTVRLVCWPEDLNRVQDEEVIIERREIGIAEIKKLGERLARTQYNQFGSRSFGRSTPSRIRSVDIEVYSKWNDETGRPYDLVAALELDRDDYNSNKRVKWTNFRRNRAA
jgi:hypothetical protein